jgi:hypothetical protein
MGVCMRSLAHGVAAFAIHGSRVSARVFPSPWAATIHLDRGRSLVLFASNGVIPRLHIFSGYARGSFLVAGKNSCAITLLPGGWPRLPSPRQSVLGRGGRNFRAWTAR